MAKSEIKTFAVVITVICLLLSVGFNVGYVISKLIIEQKLEQHDQKIKSLEDRSSEIKYKQTNIASELSEIKINLKMICKKLGIDYIATNNTKGGG